MTIRTAIADDAMLLRQGIEAVLVAGGCEVVASVGSADELLAVAEADQDLDAVVLDIRMPPGFSDEGIVALETLRARGRNSAHLRHRQRKRQTFAPRAEAETCES